MKRAFAILMITAMMLPNLMKIGILIDFKINQDFIAEAFCINKNEPITMCDGKCYLSEQLKKAEEKEEKQAPTSKTQRLDVVYYYSRAPLDLFTIADVYRSKLNAVNENEFYTSSFIADIFRPPKLV